MAPVRVATAALIVCILLGQWVASPARVSGLTGGVRSTITNFDGAGHQVVRFDVDGDAIDAHEGNISLFGDTYYLYGTSYGCGFREYRATPFCGFKVYSSPDLVHWTDRGPLFDASTPYWQQRCGGGGPTGGGCYRPQVAYDAHTDRYVLWFSAQDVGVGYHVVESASPTGPFLEQPAPQLAVNADDAPDAAYNGDETLFVDDDGTAYLVHTDWHRQGDLVVEQLDDRYESGTGRFVRLGLRYAEAPTMFKRSGRYYIVASDPNCPFCTGTGSVYMTAPAPLGPWTGADPDPPLYWQIQDAVLQANGGDTGYSIPGGKWTDYSFAFDTEPLTATNGLYARSGWVFRAHNAGKPSGPATNGYLWSLSNDPSLGPGGALVETVLQDGQAISRTVPLTFPVTAGQWYHVRMDVAGSIITTTIDGQIVDVRSDATYTQGHVGFMESTAQGERALFRNVSVTAPDETPLLTDLSQFDAPLPQRTPIGISRDSCGGQPTHVTVIPGVSGSIYLYQSDLWSGPDTAGLANYYWAPLSFDADGGIAPIACEPSSTLDLAVGEPGYQNAPADLDQTSGVDGFEIASPDVFGPYMRLQTFTPSRTGVLSRLSLTAYNSFYGTTAPLLLDVVTLDAQGRPSATLVSDAVPAGDLNYSARDGIVMPNVPVEAGRRYGILLHSATAQGSYGVVYNDANPYPRGVEEVSADGGATWTVEPGRALKFSVSVTSPAPTPTIPSGPTATPAPAGPTMTPVPPPITPSPLPGSAPSPVAGASPSPTLTPPPAPSPIASTVPVPTSVPPITPVPTVAASPKPPAPTATVGGITHAPTSTPVASMATGTASPLSPTPAATAIATVSGISHAPSSTPTARVSRSPLSNLPLHVGLAPARVVSGEWLRVRVQTAAHGTVTLTLTLDERISRIAPKGAGWERIIRTPVLYRITHRGTATGAGLWTSWLKIGYAPWAAMQAHVSVHVARGRMSRTAQLSVVLVPSSRGKNGKRGK